MCYFTVAYLWPVEDRETVTDGDETNVTIQQIYRVMLDNYQRPLEGILAKNGMLHLLTGQSIDHQVQITITVEIQVILEMKSLCVTYL